ncbi:MAG: hypothetical protein FWG63_07535 [Defluviitaleaceae bacterium]|nr:hypothetical protein [Defluviitaleaceae bacterium]
MIKLKKKSAVYIALATVFVLAFSFISVSLASDNGNTSAYPGDVELSYEADIVVSPTDSTATLNSYGLSTSEQEQIDTTQISIGSMFYGTTITVLYMGHTATQNFEQHGINAAAQMYMIQNPGVTVNVVNVVDASSLNDADYTLIDSRAIDWRSPSVSANLADWFEVMYADPNFNESDWFLNAFDAMAVEGRLTVFPRSFLFGVIGANERVVGLTDAFAQYNTITNRDLLALHERFATEAFPYMYFLHNPIHTPIYQIDRFLDTEAGQAEFDNEEFENLLIRIGGISISEHTTELHTAMLDDGFTDGVQIPFSTAIGNLIPEFTENLLGSYLFRQYIAPNSLEAFFHWEIAGGGFIGHVPIVDSTGNLLITHHHNPEFALSSGATPAQQAVAWDFMQFLQTPFANNRMRMHALPTFKPLFHHMVDIGVRQNIDLFTHNMYPVNLSMDNPMEYYKERITNILYTAANMPMRHIQPASQPIIDILSEVLADFDNGIISAQQAAERLQSRVSNYLN